MLETLPAETATGRRRDPGPLRRALSALASLRLTVVLFALSMVLVFVGTLAQMDASIWSVVTRYFRSWFVWVPLQLFVRLGQVFLGFPTHWALPAEVGFPFPGGWTIGLLLLANLLAAHATRFRLSWKRSGVLTLHLGVILLLVGEIITGLYQVEQRMTIAEGEAVNFTDRGAPPEVELALSAPAADNSNDEVVIPQSLLRQGTRLTGANLPCDVEVLTWSNNSGLRGAADDPEGVPGSDGRRYKAEPAASASSGVDTAAAEDVPVVRVRFLERGSGRELATGTFSLWYDPNVTRTAQRPKLPDFAPQRLTAGGRDWRVALRPVREYKPYTLTLIDFKHDVYIGTDRPRNFSSLVRLQDAERGEDREVLIFMNSPLRYRGEAFFQSSFMPGDRGTVLHVVRNPGWVLPYVACVVVTLGMMVHFGLGLSAFLAKKAAA
jgi:hypothetical protein